MSLRKYESKIGYLKKIITTLSKENENLQKDNDDLKNQIHVLKENDKENVSSKESLKEKQILNNKVKYL